MRALITTVVVCSLLSVAQAADQPVVAKVGTHTISRAELEKRLKSELMEIDMQRYETLREGLDEMIGEELIKLEAAARGVTPEALTKQEIEDKAGKPTDEQAQKLYDANKDKIGNASFDSVKSRLMDHLKQGMFEERRQAFVDELKKKYKTEVSLQAPDGRCRHGWTGVAWWRAQRPGDDDRVLRLRVPVLQESRRDGPGGHEDIR